MSMETLWKQINEKEDEALFSLLSPIPLKSLSSKNPLQKLKSSLIINMIFGVIICIGYVIIIYLVHVWQVQVALAFVLIFSAWTVYSAMLQYKKLYTKVSVNPLLVELKKHYQSFENWINLQLRVAVVAFPVCVVAGFMLGIVLGTDVPLEIFMRGLKIQIALLVCAAVMVPAAYYITKRMFERSFGKHLKVLKENIQHLENGV